MRFLSLIIIASFLLIQCKTEGIEIGPINEVATQDDLVKDDIHYVIFQIDQNLVNTSKDQVNQFNKTNGYKAIRISSLVMEDVNLGPTDLIIARGFKSKTDAELYHISSKENSLISNLKALVVSRPDYQSLLMKKDLKHYNWSN